MSRPARPLTDGQKAYLDKFDALLADKPRRDQDPRFTSMTDRLAATISKPKAIAMNNSTTVKFNTCQHPECNEPLRNAHFKQKYCSRQCAASMQLVSSRRSYERRVKGRELSIAEVLELMRQTPSSRGRTHRIAETVDIAKPRRCDYDHNGEACITVLCRYNPGPYCFHHAEVIAAQVQAEHDRKRALELKEMELIWGKTA